MQNKNAVILDVRENEELEETGYIRNAIHIDYLKDDFIDKVSTLDKSKTYFVYCRSGARSFSAMEEMEKLGFIKLVMLSGGIVSWRDEFLPLEKN